jgi:protoporphyrinogen oxidase
VTGTVVIGGGVTGLAAGIATGGTVLEATEEPGGICGSYYVRPGTTERLPARPADGDAYRFEVGGGHWIFGGDPAVLDLLGRHTPLVAHERRAAVHLAASGATVAYPFQDHVAELDGALAARARAEQAAAVAPTEPTMDAWFEARFGRSLCERFFHPFHERYTAGLYRTLAPQDAYKSPSGAAPGPRGYNVTFRYPPAGLDVLARSMAAAADVRYDARVVAIDPLGRTLGLADGREVAYRRVLATVPLDVALRLAAVDPTTLPPPDPATSVLVVNIGGQRGRRCPAHHWLYDPEAEAGFHRYGVYSNVDPSFVPGGDPGRVAIYVEHAMARGARPSAADEAALVDATVRELQARDVVGEVEVVDVSWVDAAYTWTRPGSTWAAEAIAALEALGIEPVGRYARWHFQGIAESVAEGLAAGRRPATEDAP